VSIFAIDLDVKAYYFTLRMKFPAFLAILIFFSFHALAQHFEGQETGLPSSICDDVANSKDCAKKIEEVQIPLFKKNVKRLIGALGLMMRTGNFCTLSNDTIIAADAVWYHFRTYYPEFGFYEVHAQYAEGEAYLLIDDTLARSQQLIGAPVFSPNRTRLIAMCEGLESGYNPNKIQICKIGRWTLAKEFEYTAQNWGPRSAVWLSNDKIAFTKCTNKYDPLLNEWKISTSPDTLFFASNRWQFKHE
jgi:hypothetical protein